MTKTDNQLKHDIELELTWDPQVNAAQIGVSVDNGAVSLLGIVDTYAERWAAEQAVKRVAGVRVVAHGLTVEPLTHHRRSDADIASAAQRVLAWNVLVPNTVTARVQAGWVTLGGMVTSHFERQAAEFALRHLKGVVGVTNGVSLKPHASSDGVKLKIEAALARQATADAKSIHVEAAAGKVTLTGQAASWRAREEAADAAWTVPGVNQVDDRVTVAMVGG